MARPHANAFRRNEAGMSGARRHRFFPRRAIVLLAAILLACSGIGLAQKKQELEKNYRDWLERDVAYIISKHEPAALLKLTSDEARETFIETSWASRNPSPGSPAHT